MLVSACYNNLGGVFGKAGGSVAEVAAETGKSAVKAAAKRVVKAGVCEAAGGFATDVGRQLLVEGKSPEEIDVGQVIETSAVAGFNGMLGAVIGIFGESAKKALAKAKEAPGFGVVDGLHSETWAEPGTGYTTLLYDAEWTTYAGGAATSPKNAGYVTINISEYYTDADGYTKFVTSSAFGCSPKNYSSVDDIFALGNKYYGSKDGSTIIDYYIGKTLRQELHLTVARRKTPWGRL